MRDLDDTQTIDAFPFPSPSEQPRRGPGRPRQHATAAAKQRAYRRRLKERGLVERSRIMAARIPEAEPLSSSVLDLSGNVQRALEECR